MKYITILTMSKRKFEDTEEKPFIDALGQTVEFVEGYKPGRLGSLKPYTARDKLMAMRKGKMRVFRAQLAKEFGREVYGPYSYYVEDDDNAPDNWDGIMREAPLSGPVLPFNPKYMNPEGKSFYAMSMPARPDFTRRPPPKDWTKPDNYVAPAEEWTYRHGAWSWDSGLPKPKFNDSTLMAKQRPIPWMNKRGEWFLGGIGRPVYFNRFVELPDSPDHPKSHRRMSSLERMRRIAKHKVNRFMRSAYFQGNTFARKYHKAPLPEEALRSIASYIPGQGNRWRDL
jgi:hypothetical protein